MRTWNLLMICLMTWSLNAQNPNLDEAVDGTVTEGGLQGEPADSVEEGMELQGEEGERDPEEGTGLEDEGERGPEEEAGQQEEGGQLVSEPMGESRPIRPGDGEGEPGELAAATEPYLVGKGQVVLRYLTREEDFLSEEEAEQGGGSIVAALKDVRQQMVNSRGRMTESIRRRLTATATYPLEIYVREESPERWILHLKPSQPAVRVPPFIQAGIQRSLKREAREVLAELQAWEQPLTLQQILELKLKGESTQELVRPFEPLIMWPRPEVTLGLRRSVTPKVTELKFYQITPRGLRPIEKLAGKSPLVVEVWFNRPPDRHVHQVRMRAGDGPVRQIVAQRVDENRRRFMTPAFVLWPESEDLPTPNEEGR